MDKKLFRLFAKSLLNAQVASDSGKRYYNDLHNSRKALIENYEIKDRYIREAIALARKLSNVWVSTDLTQDMHIVLFDVKGYGQVSFHSYADFSRVKSVGREWNGIKGGSPMTCRKLEKKLNLQIYSRFEEK